MAYFREQGVPADFLRMLICWTAAISMLAFANWLLSLEFGRTMTEIRRLIGSGSLSKATNFFLDGATLQTKIGAILYRF